MSGRSQEMPHVPGQNEVRYRLEDSEILQIDLIEVPILICIHQGPIKELLGLNVRVHCVLALNSQDTLLVIENLLMNVDPNNSHLL